MDTNDSDSAAIRVRDARGDKRFYLDNVVIDVYGPLAGPYGLALYAALCRHANASTQECFPRVKRLAHETGMSEAKARRTLKDLGELGLIHVDSGKDTGERNTYTLLEVQETPKQQKAFALGYAPGAEGSVPRTEGGSVPDTEGSVLHTEGGSVPRTEGSVPQTEGYVPDTEGCVPQTEGYAPRTEASEQTYSTNTPDNLTQDSAGDGAGAAPEHPPPKSEPKRTPKQQARDAMSNALLWVVFRLTPDQFELLSSADKSNLRRQTTKWLKQGKAPEDVRAFGEWWDRRDWRGREGQRPEFRHLGAEWGTFEQQRKQQERTDNGSPKQQRQTTDRRGNDPGDDYPTLDPARFEPAPSRAP